MNSRILPPSEWPRLAGTEADGLWPSLDPENARVLVVEDEGEIVATWTLMRVVHAECIWVRPSHRGVFGVAKRLLRGMSAIASAWGAARVVTGSVSPEVTDLITRFGGVPMPCASFILPVERRTADLDLGRWFHQQLRTQIAEDGHPEDEKHDRAVGRALRTAIGERAPERAVKTYNAWADTAGYEPIRYLGTVDGRLRADIVTAVVEVDEGYTVRVVEQEAEPCRS